MSCLLPPFSHAYFQPAQGGNQQDIGEVPNQEERMLRLGTYEQTADNDQEGQRPQSGQLPLASSSTFICGLCLTVTLDATSGRDRGLPSGLGSIDQLVTQQSSTYGKLDSPNSCSM